jgi:hypothetical protein
MYKVEEFSGMQYNPFATKGKSMSEAYPKLKRRREMWQIPYHKFEEEDYTPSEDDLDTYLKFLAILIIKDKNPVAQETDFEARKEMAYQVVGLFKNAAIRVMFEKGHWWSMDVMTAFFAIYGDTYYESWLSMKMNLASVNSFLRQPITYIEDIEKNMSARDRMAKGMDASLAQLRKMEEKLFGSSTLAEMVTASANTDERWADMMAQEWTGNFN